MPVMPAATAGLVLVADDEKSIRDLVRRVFENEGWQVQEATDATEVVSTISSGRARVDLLLLDLTMPGPPVEETVHLVNTVDPDIKIMIMSGFARDERVEKLRAEAGVEFVGKPFSPRDILSVVDAVMTGPRGPAGSAG
jgi:CheY-like chemotaxis protein